MFIDDLVLHPWSLIPLFFRLDLEDKTLHVYDGRYHEIYNEVEDLRRQVLKDLEDWLEERLGMTNREFGMWNAESGLTNGK